MLLISVFTQQTGTAGQSAGHFEGNITVQYDYLLYLPEGYLENEEELYPFVIYLHGSGERGDELNKIRKHGPPKFLDDKPDFPAIVLSPQCPSGEWWEPYKLKALIDEMLATHRIDQSRIYVTGNSMGGGGTWQLGLTYPELFAAIAPICGYGNSRAVAWRLKNTPIWTFHGAKDTSVPLEETLELVRALEAVGGNIKFTIYPEAAHDSWTVTYENPAFWEWLFSQVKP